MSHLEELLRRKQAEVAQRRRALGEEALEREAQRSPPAGSSFAGALSGAGGALAIVAEVKRASPSLGALRPSLDVASQVQAYARGGAAAISILTDGPGFGGSLEDLARGRHVTALPLLRKDFVLERYQLLEARVRGADAVLLIAAALSPASLRALLAGAARLGLDALVEVHDEGELDLALAEGAALIGVNNRDLGTFRVDLAVSERLAPRLPRSVKVVCESGIRGPEDVRRLARCGYVNFLVGEALVRAADPASTLRALVGAGR